MKHVDLRTTRSAKWKSLLATIAVSGLLILGLQPAVIAQEYCAAGATNTCCEKIGRVVFNSIDNHSPGVDVGYEDFTDISTEVVPGATYQLVVSSEAFSSYTNDQVIVWIDFMQNQNFTDAGEQVLITPTGMSPWIGNITIPVDAEPGETRMRIRLHDSGLSPNSTPCGTSGYGQVEDYTLVIVDAECSELTATSNINPVCIDGNFELTVDIEGQGNYFVSYTVDGGDSVAVGAITDTITDFLIGDFPYNTNVDVSITDLDNPLCVFTIYNQTHDGYGCPIYSCGPNQYEVCYGNSEELEYFYEAESGTDLYLRIDDGQMEACCDFFEVYDGFSTADNLLFSGNGLLPVDAVFYSNTGQLMVRITSDFSGSCQASGYTPIAYSISCDVPDVEGCSDPDAMNFNPVATIDDGSCLFPPCEGDPQNVHFCYGNNENLLYLFAGDTVMIGDSAVVGMPTIYFNYGMIEPNWDFVTIYDGENTTAPILFGPASGNLAGVTVSSTSGYMLIQVTSDGAVSCGSGAAAYSDGIDFDVYCGTAVIPGCADPDAYNYDPSATVDDGSCIFPPENDECVDAIDVPVNADMECVDFVSGTILGASGSDIDNPCGGTADDDVWFSFVAQSATHYIDLINVSGSTTDLYHSVHANSCDSLINLTCSDPNNSVVNDLTIGETYYLRVYTWTATPNQTTIFDVCIKTPPPPPANDDCINAFEVPVNDDMMCVQVVPATIEWSTPSAEPNPCIGTADDDVWFWFTATSSAHSIEMTNVTGGTTNLVHAVYAGSCDSLINLSCSDPNLSFVTGLDSGATYLVRVFSWTSITGQTTSFDMCVGTLPPPPSNDECDAPISVAINSELECDTITPGTITMATESEEPNPCLGTANDDVWFSFVAEHPEHHVDLLNVSGSTTDLYHAVYSGSCGSLVNLSCSDPNNSIVSGLTVGETYLLRVYTWSANTGALVNFDVCIKTPPPPPANDVCAEAIELFPDSGMVMATNISATPDFFNMECAFFGDPVQRDVWFSFVAPLSGGIEIETLAGGTLTDTQMQVLDACQGEVLACDEDGGNLLFSLITFQCGELTAGSTYYIQVDGYNGTEGTFGIEVRTTAIEGCTNPEAVNYEPCATVDNGSCLLPAENDVCLDAIAVECGVPVEGNTFTASVEGAPSNCVTSLNTSPGMWYVVEAPVDGMMSASLCDSEFDTKIGVFTGSCDGLMCKIGNNDDAAGAGLCGGGTASSVTWSATAGETFYIYVTGNQDAFGTFELLVTCPSIGVEELEGQSAHVSLFPNPNAGEEVRVQIDGLAAGNHDINVLVYDIYGKQITADAFGHNGTYLDRVVRFEQSLATGMYMVQIVVDGEKLTAERLVVQ